MRSGEPDGKDKGERGVGSGEWGVRSGDGGKIEQTGS